jgi:uncharacterized Zn-finger protein
MKQSNEFIITEFCCMFNDCQRTYTTKFNLKRHVEICHLKKKKYTCSYCSKLLVSQQNLREHMFIHQNLKPYKCPTCGEYFRQISQLSLHKRDHTLPLKIEKSYIKADPKPSKNLLELVMEKILNYNV